MTGQLSSEFPNCDRLSQNIERVRLLHDFLDFINDEDIKLYEYQELEYEDTAYDGNNPTMIWRKISGYMKTRQTKDDLVYKFFRINPDELSAERTTMFEKYVRKGGSE